MVQVKSLKSEALPLLNATRTEEVPVAVGVPEIRPVAPSMESPAGRPAADQVSTPPLGPLPIICKETDWPTYDACLPGATTLTEVVASTNPILARECTPDAPRPESTQ